MKNKESLKKKATTLKWVILTLIILMISVGVMQSIAKHQNPILYGKWVSKETGEWVQFNEDGTVLLEDESYKASFYLQEPNKMLYTIEDKVFTMHYALKGRTLEWYEEKGEKEIFKRR